MANPIEEIDRSISLEARVCIRTENKTRYALDVVIGPKHDLDNDQKEEKEVEKKQKEKKDF